MKNVVNLNVFSNSYDTLTFKPPHNNGYPNRKQYEISKANDNVLVMNLHQIGFQVTEDCNLRCSYCYQLDKCPKRMTFDECKQGIDMLFGSDEEKYCKFIINTPFTIHFIGGEPLLEDKLVYDTLKYFSEKLKENNLQDINWNCWIPTNGIPIEREYSQKILDEFGNHMIMAVSLDGCEECHNQCRVYENGKGSYTETKKAFDIVSEKLHKGHYPDTKFTMSPDNLKYFKKSIIDWLDEGVYHVFSNWIIEEEFTEEESRDYYYQCKDVIDYILDKNLEDVVRFGVFDRCMDTYFEDYRNLVLCGAAGHNIMIIPGGEIYPCVRHASTSLDDDVKPFIIGTLKDGIAYNDETKKNFFDMYTTRYDISSFKCFNCPVAMSCINCVACFYNERKVDYNIRKNYNECNIAIADHLARVYGLNKMYRKKEMTNKDYFFKVYKILVSDDQALSIIDRNELDMLKYLSKEC